MKRLRGHYCWVCGRIRANERFSGRGHRDHVCKDCAVLRRRMRRAKAKAEVAVVSGKVGRSRRLRQGRNEPPSPLPRKIT